MGEIDSGLDRALWLTACVTVGYQLFFFFIAAYFKFDKVTDLAGGSNFLFLALLTFCQTALPEPSTRQLCITIIVCIWALRLKNPMKFLAFWVMQMLWVWVVSLPVIYVNTSNCTASFGPRDYAGVILASVGLIIETSADASKFQYKLHNTVKGHWCDWGLWNYSRHPNYFGEIIFWWGIFILASPTFTSGGGYFTIASPAFITALLLFFSGMPILEQNANKAHAHKADYLQYRQDTSILIPLPKTLYNSIPLFLKRVFLLEWPLYEEGLHSPQELSVSIVPPAQP